MVSVQRMRGPEGLCSEEGLGFLSGGGGPLVNRVTDRHL